MNEGARKEVMGVCVEQWELLRLSMCLLDGRKGLLLGRITGEGCDT